jgi:ankyrin repeat protein
MLNNIISLMMTKPKLKRRHSQHGDCKPSSCSEIDVLEKRFLRAVASNQSNRLKDLMQRFTLTREALNGIKDKKGNTMLHIAVINKNQHMIRLLGERGIDLNSKNKDGNTPLHYGVRMAHYECVDVLI